MTYNIQIRPKRQVTLPAPLLEKLGAGVGDYLQIDIKNKKATVKAKKQIALDALVEIQKLVKGSAVSKKEMLKSTEKIRIELNEKRST